jgi:hypothetical protein
MSADGATSEADAASFPLCDRLPLGPSITQTASMTTPPVQQGGAIVDGLYFLTQAHVYGSGSSVTLAQSFAIQKGTLHSTAVVNGESEPDLIALYDLSSPTQLSLTFADCVDGGISDAGPYKSVYDYSATATTFTMSRQGASTIVYVFTKQ